MSAPSPITKTSSSTEFALPTHPKLVTKYQIIPRIDSVIQRVARRIPNECFQTLERLEDPVVTKCGHLFNRTIIQKWLNTTPICPVCETLLPPLDPPRSLRSALKEALDAYDLTLQHTPSPADDAAAPQIYDDPLQARGKVILSRLYLSRYELQERGRWSLREVQTTLKKVIQDFTAVGATELASETRKTILLPISRHIDNQAKRIKNDLKQISVFNRDLRYKNVPYFINTKEFNPAVHSSMLKDLFRDLIAAKDYRKATDLAQATEKVFEGSSDFSRYALFVGIAEDFAKAKDWDSAHFAASLILIPESCDVIRNIAFKKSAQVDDIAKECDVAIGMIKNILSTTIM